jgi:threonine dehydrogenase-like Zn-dependent dehydrogenase
VTAESVGATPAGADPNVMSVVPVAATSALRGLRRLGPVLGRRVLVLGGTSTVGLFAVQLAARAGAEVVATTRNPAAGERLVELGAREVVASPSDLNDDVSGVLDLLGGSHLVRAFARLAPGGARRVPRPARRRNDPSGCDHLLPAPRARRVTHAAGPGVRADGRRRVTAQLPAGGDAEPPATCP